MAYIRLNKFANNFNEVNVYYQDRAKQILSDRYFWNNDCKPIMVDNQEIGVETSFIKDGNQYFSYYIYESFRGHRLYSRIASKEKPVVTVDDCHLEEYLLNHNYSYKVANIYDNSFAYEFITKFYGNKVSKRSKVPYMYHIDEGLYILNNINASVAAKEAYMLHPLLQSDEDFKNNYEMIINDNFVSKEVLALTLEYRNIANAYLSPRNINHINEFNLSPIEDVNDMLVADKIQNYKDFLRYHLGTHPRSEILNQYFLNWLSKLKITSMYYENMIKQLNKTDICV